MYNFSFMAGITILESNITEEQSIFWKFSDFYHPIHGWLSTIACTFGIILNFLNIIVLTRRNMVNIQAVKLLFLRALGKFLLLQFFCVI